MSDPTEIIAELQAEVRRLAAAERRRSMVHRVVLIAAILLAAGAAFAQPVITTFVADSPALATQVNDNFTQVTSFTVPKNGIIFFDGANCPSGWTQIAQGRTIVGRPTTGTNGLAFGAAISGNNEPVHSHSMSTNGDHSHGGQTGGYSDWIAGTVNWPVQQGFNSPYHHRHSIGNDGAHAHTIYNQVASAVIPFVFYTACRKD